MAVDFPPAVDALPSSPPSRPLVVAEDGPLLEAALQAAAAAGVEVEVCADPGQARGSWPAASLVLLSTAAAQAVGRAGLRRRAGVVVLATDVDDTEAWKAGVALGADTVMVLPAAEASLISSLADAVEGDAATARTVGVIGGRGGAGASTLAAALALAGARRGLASWLVDADPYGGGLDLVLGGEDLPGLRWPDLAGTTGRLSAAALRTTLPTCGGVHVVSWDRGRPGDLDPDMLRAVLAAAARSGGLAVVDLPRSPLAATSAGLDRLDVGLVVVPAEVRAAVAAARVAAALSSRVDDVRVVVRGPAPSGLPGRLIADSLGLPLAGELRPEPRLADDLERGEPPGRSARSPLRRFSDGLVAALFPEGSR